MQHRKFFKTVSITLGLCGGAIIIPTLASCSEQQTRDPSLKESINLNVKFSDLLTTNGSPTNGANSKAVPAATTEVLKTPKQLFEEEFKKHPQEFIDNYDVLTQDQVANLKLETTAKNTNDNFNNGSMTYEQWSKKSSTTVTHNKKAIADMSIEKVYYPNDGSYFTVSSPKELHDKLVKDITNIFEKIQGKPTENKTVTYKLNDNSKIGYTKNDDLLHVNVTKTETTPDQSKELNKDITETQYDLCIPTSSVFFFVKSDTLKVTYMKEENTLLDLSRGVTYLNFDIGIQGQAMSEKFTKENLMIGIKQQPIKAGKTQININTVLTDLGWIKEEASGNQKDGEIVLDQQKISKDLNVFNASFSEPKLFKIDNGTNANATYRVGFSAAPTVNHSWAIDGSIEKKLITTGDIKIMNGTGLIEETDEIIFDLGSQSETLAPKIINQLSTISNTNTLQMSETVKTMIETEVKKVVGSSNVTVEVITLQDFHDGKTMQKANVDIKLSNNVSIIGNSSLFKLKDNNVITLADSVTTKLISTSPNTNKS